MCHSVKLWERLIEARLRQITSIGNTQYGFRPGKSATEPIQYFNTANSPGKTQKDEQRGPHGLRRFGEDIRPSTPLFDMMVSPEEMCPRGACYDYTIYVQ